MKKKDYTTTDYQAAIAELSKHISKDYCLVNPKTGEKTRGKKND